MDVNSDKLKSIFKDIRTLTVVGGNWGDEGKGKVIDLVMGQYDIVARFSGGANAGHTVFTPDGKKLVSHLIPCGLAQNKICVLARGEFFNLELFLKELVDSKAVLGDKLPPIYIDMQAPLWTPYHLLFENYIEIARDSSKIGTTSKGIGPLEGIYKLRLAPLVGHLFEPDLLQSVMGNLYRALKPCLDLAGADIPVPTPKQVVDDLLVKAGEIETMVSDTGYFLHESLQKGQRILFEGAQATGLDAWWGTYPFVSSGNSAAGGAALGTGLPMQAFDATILVAKTLPSRVGNGPFPSEIWERQGAMNFAKEHLDLFLPGTKRDEFLASGLEKINSGTADASQIAQYFQVLGDERGATTGRGRSLGYLDIPWLLYAIRINQPKYLALTRFDMLSKVKTIPVITAYKFRGETLPPGKIPAPWQFGEIETVIENWPVFEQDIFGVSNEADLPETARKFLQNLEKQLGVPILLVGTGPSRNAMIVRA